MFFSFKCPSASLSLVLGLLSNLNSWDGFYYAPKFEEVNEAY